MWVWVTLASAQAQVSGGAVPEINAQTFRPTVDGRRLLWLDDGAKGESGVVGRALLQYVDDPLVYVDTNDEVVELVSSILQLDVLAAARLGPLRLGVDVPIYLLANGSPNGNETGLGDLGIDGKLTLLDRGLDLAIGSRFFLPTSTVDQALGSPSVGYEVTGIVSGDAGPLLLSANVGTRGGPSAELENVALNDFLLARLGAALRLSEVIDTALEFNGQFPYTTPLATADGSPLEFLASAAVRPRRSDWVVRAGGGTGLRPGIGSPDYRLILGLGWEPRDDEPVVVEPEPLCPGEVEDFDGFEDEDGCPEPTPVTVSVIDAETGEPIDVAKVTVVSPRLKASGTVTSEDPFTQDFEAGEVEITARAKGYVETVETFVVENGPPTEAVVKLQPLGKKIIVVKRKKLEINQTIQFETNSDVIKAESFELLNETAETIKEYKEIRKLRIEGHTDQRGSATYNLELSKRRAASVVRYFIAQGVEPERLESQGYGESKLLNEANTSEAWAENRRVDFFVEYWEPIPIQVEITEMTDDMVPMEPEELEESEAGSP
ncbi:MAG: OmpA family protein [Myxococcota bacterium]